MKIYKFTDTLTKRPYSRKLSGTVRVIGDVFEAITAVREVLKDNIGEQDQGTSIKINITPTNKKI